MGSLDLKKRGVEKNKTNAIGSNWKEIRKELFSQEEIHKSDERVASIRKIIEEINERTEKRLEISVRVNSD